MDLRQRVREHPHLWSMLRIVATVAMLAVLLTRVKVDQIVPHWDLDTVGWIGLAIGVTLVGVVFAAVRWQRVLVALDLRSRISRLLPTYLAGLFISNFLPTTIAGDALRVSRVASDTGETPRSFASVVLERLTGWAVLPLLSLAALAINPSLLHLPGGTGATRAVIVLCLITLGALTAILFVAGHPKLGGRFNSQAGWKRFSGAIHVGIDQFRHRPRVAIQVLVAGLAYQLAVILAAFAAGRALGLPVGWTAFMAYMPIVAIIQVLPLTIGGLGLREGALAVLLAPLGVSQSHAIALGLLVYGINVVVSLLGAPSFAIGRRNRGGGSPGRPGLSGPGAGGPVGPVPAGA